MGQYISISSTLFHHGKAHNLFSQLTIENHLGDFQLLYNGAVMNIPVHKSLRIVLHKEIARSKCI